MHQTLTQQVIAAIIHVKSHRLPGLYDVMKNTATRDKLIDSGAELIAQQGYNATGINAVLKTCGVPKGSFYHYFSSKEDL